MTIPIRYVAPSSAIASYDDVDLATGTGIINFYAGTMSGASPVGLSNQQFWSSHLSTTGSTGSSSLTKIKDLNFDVILNRPMNLRGDLVVNVPMHLQQTGGTTGTGRIDVTLKRVRDGVATTIATLSGAVRTTTAGADNYFIDTGKLSVPATHFKIGDLIRLNVISFAFDAGGGTTTIGIGHDPRNRATATGSTDNWGTTPSNLIAGIPVRIPV